MIWQRLLLWAATLDRKDVAGITFATALIVVVGVIVLGLEASPRWIDAQKSTNAGFGPDWDCQGAATPGGITPICVKKTTKRSD